MKLTPEQEAECRVQYVDEVTDGYWENSSICIRFRQGFAAGLAARERETEPWAYAAEAPGAQGEPGFITKHPERYPQIMWFPVWRGKPAPINSPAEPSANTEGVAQSQEPVATLQMSDPDDERLGPWFSLPDLKKLSELPPGTKLYTHPLAGRPEGWKLLKDSTFTERTWHEDFGENSKYMNECSNCGRGFVGHKGCVICRVCATAPAAPKDAEDITQQPEFATLMRFYGVDDLAALVRAQEQHIQRLQSKLPTPRDEFPPSPRAG